MIWYKDTEWTVIFWCSTVTSLLSLCGAMALVITYFTMREFKTEIRRLIMILSIVDALINLSFLSLLWATQENDLACRLFTILATFFPTCSVLWTMNLSYTSYKKLVVNVGETWTVSRPLNRFFHVVAWGYPSFVCLVMISFPNYYNVESVGCWIPRRPWTNQALRLVGVYLVVWIAWIFNGIVYYQIITHGREMFKTSDVLLREKLSTADEQLKRLAWIPIAFVIIRFWGSINAIKDVVAPDVQWFPIDVLQAIGDASQGFIHGVIFVFINRHFRRKVSQIWANPCGWMFGVSTEEAYSELMEAHARPLKQRGYLSNFK